MSALDILWVGGTLVLTLENSNIGTDIIVGTGVFCYKRDA